MKSYDIAVFLSRFKKNKREYISEFFRKKGVNVGDHCNICSDITTLEPYLISIGDNVTISTGVSFATHDASAAKIFGAPITDIAGRIVIGSNCFIGMGTIILCGVNLADNIIVAAGSVVTKSFYKSNIIIGGNPAKEIGNWEDYRQKYDNYKLNLNGKKAIERKNALINSDRLLNK